MHICPCCKSKQTSNAFTKSDVPYMLCRQCDFLFGLPERNQNLENCLNDYEASYISYLSEGIEDSVNFDHMLNWISKSKPINMIQTSLDVGAGGGKFVRHLRKKNINAFGIEPAIALYDHFLANEDFYIFGSFSSARPKLPHENFDLISACDVIEHMENPEEIFTESAKILKEGGILVVSTPDRGSWTAKIFGRYWHYINPYHISIFTRKNLIQLAAKHGFEEVEFARLSRYKSLQYLVQYTFDFVFRKNGTFLSERIADIHVPINLFDVMYISFRKSRK